MKICPACQQRFSGPAWTCAACGFDAPTQNGVRLLMPQEPDVADGYDPDAFERCAELEHGSFWFEARNELIIWALEKYFPDLASFLEVGCGTGFVLGGIRRVMSDIRLTGTDPFLEGLAFARSRLGDVELAQMDATRLPYDEEFDAAGAFDVIEHLDDDAAALREIHRALRPGGGVIITVPQHPWLWGRWDEAARHVRRYRRPELLAKVHAAGFAVERITSFVCLLFPLMVAARLRQRAGGSTGDRSDLRPGRLNNLLARAMRAEAALIRKGASLPFGGSLLIVARKPPTQSGSLASTVARG